MALLASPALASIHAELMALVAAGARLAVKAPPPWAALLLGAGIVFLLHGARHRYVLAIPGGGVLGILAARLVVSALNGPGAAVQTEILWVAGGLGALGCGGWPPIFPPLALAVPGLAIGAFLPIAGQAWLGALAWGAGGALVGLLTREWVAAMAAGALGSATAIAGGLGLLANHAIGRALLDHPMAIVAIWSILTVAGAAFHAGRAWPRPAGPRADEPYAGDRPIPQGTTEYDGWRG